MDNFLDADCVLNALFEKGVLVKKVWKLDKGTTSHYDVLLELTTSAKIVGFVIYIKGTYHCIGMTALINQAKRFRIPVDDIILLCVIK